MGLLSLPSTAISDSTSAGRTLLTAADVAAQRTALGVATGDSPEFAAVNVGHASDTTITRSSAGVIAVEGVAVPLNSTTSTHTAQQIELGHASDTTLTRSSAGVLAVEGVAVPLNSTTSTHTAQQIELGHASDTTLTRSSAGVLAVEGVAVPLNSTTSTHTAQQIELGHATDTTITRVSAGVAAIEGSTILTGNGITGTNASSALSANFSITAASGTYEATGLSFSLPSAGTYLLTWQARVSLNSSVAGTLLAGILRNTTDAANVTNSFAVLACQQVASVSIQSTSGAACVLTVAASKTIELYVQRNGSGFSTTDVIAAGIGGDKGTVITYVKISN